MQDSDFDTDIKVFLIIDDWLWKFLYRQGSLLLRFTMQNISLPEMQVYVLLNWWNSTC